MQKLTSSDFLRLRHSLVTLVEDLKLRKKCELDNEAKIHDLMSRNHELQRTLDLEVQKTKQQEEKFERSLSDLRHDYEGKLKRLDANLQQKNMKTECKAYVEDKMKEEMKMLELTIYRQNKTIRELETKIQTQQSSSEKALTQWANLETKMSSLNNIYQKTTESLHRLEKDVHTAKELNQKLAYVNNHNQCQMKDKDGQVSQLQQELLQLRVDRSSQQSQAREVQELKGDIEGLQDKIKDLNEQIEKQKEEITQQASSAKQAITNLQAAHSLINTHLDTANRWRAESQRLSQDLTMMTTQCIDLKTQLNDAEVKLNMNESKWTKAEEDWDSMTHKLQDCITDNKREIQNLQQEVSSLRDEKEQLLHRKDELMQLLHDANQKNNPPRSEMSVQVERSFSLSDQKVQATPDVRTSSAQTSLCLSSVTASCQTDHWATRSCWTMTRQDTVCHVSVQTNPILDLGDKLGEVEPTEPRKKKSTDTNVQPQLIDNISFIPDNEYIRAKDSVEPFKVETRDIDIFNSDLTKADMTYQQTKVVVDVGVRENNPFEGVIQQATGVIQPTRKIHQSRSSQEIGVTSWAYPRAEHNISMMCQGLPSSEQYANPQLKKDSFLNSSKAQPLSLNSTHDFIKITDYAVAVSSSHLLFGHNSDLFSKNKNLQLPQVTESSMGKIISTELEDMKSEENCINDGSISYMLAPAHFEEKSVIQHLCTQAISESTSKSEEGSLPHIKVGSSVVDSSVILRQFPGKLSTNNDLNIIEKPPVLDTPGSSDVCKEETGLTPICYPELSSEIRAFTPVLSSLTVPSVIQDIEDSKLEDVFSLKNQKPQNITSAEMNGPFYSSYGYSCLVKANVDANIENMKHDVGHLTAGKQPRQGQHAVRIVTIDSIQTSIMDYKIVYNKEGTSNLLRVNKDLHKSQEDTQYSPKTDKETSRALVFTCSKGDVNKLANCTSKAGNANLWDTHEDCSSSAGRDCSLKAESSDIDTINVGETHIPTLSNIRESPEGGSLPIEISDDDCEIVDGVGPISCIKDSALPGVTNAAINKKTESKVETAGMTESHSTISSMEVKIATQADHTKTEQYSNLKEQSNMHDGRHPDQKSVNERTDLGFNKQLHVSTSIITRSNKEFEKFPKLLGSLQSSEKPQHSCNDPYCFNTAENKLEPTHLNTESDTAFKPVHSPLLLKPSFRPPCKKPTIAQTYPSSNSSNWLQLCKTPFSSLKVTRADLVNSETSQPATTPFASTFSGQTVNSDLFSPQHPNTATVAGLKPNWSQLVTPVLKNYPNDDQSRMKQESKLSSDGGSVNILDKHSHIPLGTMPGYSNNISKLNDQTSTQKMTAGLMSQNPFTCSSMTPSSGQLKRPVQFKLQFSKENNKSSSSKQKQTKKVMAPALSCVTLKSNISVLQSNIGTASGEKKPKGILKGPVPNSLKSVTKCVTFDQELEEHFKGLTPLTQESLLELKTSVAEAGPPVTLDHHMTSSTEELVKVTLREKTSTMPEYNITRPSTSDNQNQKEDNKENMMTVPQGSTTSSTFLGAPSGLNSNIPNFQVPDIAVSEFIQTVPSAGAGLDSPIMIQTPSCVDQLSAMERLSRPRFSVPETPNLDLLDDENDFTHYPKTTANVTGNSAEGVKGQGLKKGPTTKTQELDCPALKKPRNT